MRHPSSISVKSTIFCLEEEVGLLNIQAANTIAIVAINSEPILYCMKTVVLPSTSFTEMYLFPEMPYDVSVYNDKRVLLGIFYKFLAYPA